MHTLHHIQNNSKQKGQALIILMFYMIIAITLTTTAIALAISNSVAVTQDEEGNHALEAAESGAENALLRLLRDVSYSGETSVLDNGTAAISVSGDTQKTIVSTGSVGSYSKTVIVTATIVSGVLTIDSWKEQ